MVKFFRTAIPRRILDFTNYAEDGRFKKISPEKLSSFQIVVTTLGLIGRYQDKYKPDILFVDEAAQACEPEINCALGVLRGKHIILAGDPNQLGPLAHSKIAEEYGFGNMINVVKLFCFLHIFISAKSLLERLMDLDIYQNGHENYITMLKRNFRSHPLILQVSNELFYDGKLLVSLIVFNRFS